jgi:hypothetical protein
MSSGKHNKIKNCIFIKHILSDNLTYKVRLNNFKVEPEEPAQEYAIRHNGMVRETLSKYGYYTSLFGLIMNDKEDNYSLGDIRFFYTFGKRKEGVIVSTKNRYEDYKGTEDIILFLKKERIPFKKTKIKTEEQMQLKIEQAEARLEKIIKRYEKKHKGSNAQIQQSVFQD